MTSVLSMLDYLSRSPSASSSMMLRIEFLIDSVSFFFIYFFFSSRRRHTRFDCDWSSDGALPILVAKNYFKLKKAYVAALKRCEEIIAGNPNFAKIDEVLLMAGQSSLWLAEKKGKQSPDLYVTFDGGQKRTLTAEQFREMGREYLSKLIKDYPEGPYAKQAREELRARSIEAKP